MYYSTNLWRIRKRQLSNKYSADVLHLSFVLKYRLYFSLSVQGKAYLIDDQSRGNNEQSGYLQIYEKHQKDC